MESNSNKLIQTSLEFLTSIHKHIDRNEIIAETVIYMGQGMFHANIIFALNVDPNTYKFIYFDIFFGLDINDSTQNFIITPEIIHFKDIYIKNYGLFEMSSNDPPKIPDQQYYYVENIIPFNYELIEWYRKLTENRDDNEKSYKYQEYEENKAYEVSNQTISLSNLSKIYGLI